VSEDQRRQTNEAADSCVRHNEGVSTAVATAKPLEIGPLTVWPPVVLAPMAGVTNPPFRALCRSYGAGLYVSEMVMAKAILGNSARTERMLQFGADERPRSLQLYVTDPVSSAEAVRKVVGSRELDHIDLNFGCPAPKVTRNGGGSAVPLKKNLLRAIVRAVVEAAGPVPVTMKFRKGVSDDLITFLHTGRIAVDEGVKAIALHARTAEQAYSGSADWNAIGELKQHVPEIPVLGNGDIWHAHHALAMMRQTDCDGVVIGRGCLGRPWLFGDLVAAFEGREVEAAPVLGVVTDVMRRHAQGLVDFVGEGQAMREFRKHTGWYLTGYAVGSDIRRRLSMVSTLAELDDLMGELPPELGLPADREGLPRGHTNGPRPVPLPYGYLDNLDDDTPPVELDDVGSGG
jgi:nifR3 family TIM-barrel protein